MTKRLNIASLIVCSILLLLRPVCAYAITEQNVKYLNGPFVVSHSFFSNQDPVFENPAYTWSSINNISVQDAVTLRVVDSVLISTSFTVSITVDIRYYTNPDTVDYPGKDTTVTLSVNYVAGQGALFKSIGACNFTGAYKINVTVTGINNFGTTIPGLALQLSSSIVIDRKYPFSGSTVIAPSYTTSHSVAQLNAAWSPVTGAEQYDLEWTTINDGNDNFSVIDNRYKNPGNTDNAAVTAALTTIFRNNASRVTMPAKTTNNNYTLSLLSTDTYIVLRIRQVQYQVSGVRETGAWQYMQSGGSLFAIFPLNWHQQYLNWQYSAAYAEDGKKKEVVSYFDGSLRGRQTVTLNNTDNIALAQENVYDAFGRPAASILPAAFVDSSGTSYLHFNVNFNKNSAGNTYNYGDLNTLGSYCEWTPDSMSTVSGASKYYSSRNAFYNFGTITSQKPYNSFIPSADRYPLSVTQYTPDNTGRIKMQGGVGMPFQPGKANVTGASYTTKYFYGKPEQDELDQLFGNDVGFAEHYLKNMVVDLNGQISVSYINASGKTIATALSGNAPSTLDTLPSFTRPSLQVSSLHILSPDQFIYNSSNLTLTASTTYMNSVIDTGRLAFSIQNLIDKFPGGADSICSNCFYQMTVNISDDCGDTLPAIRTPVNIGSGHSNCAAAPLYSNSIPVNFTQIGPYYVTIQFAMNRDTITAMTDNFITQGTANGFIQQQAYYIKQHYLDSIQLSGCYSDCSSCYALLGTQANFVSKVQAELIRQELDSVAVRGTLFTNWAIYLYNKLIDSCAASQAHCFNPCQSVQDAMEQDVSPGGQYALFDSTGVAVEPAINVLYNNWRVVFPVKSSSDPVYQANLITQSDGTVTSPNDVNFTLPELVTYWQAPWGALFLQYHPEYCKLVFCNTMSSYESWDNQVQQINLASQVDLIPGGSSLTYSYTNAADWLLSTDPLFKTGAPGNSYYAQMQADLLNYSVNVMGITQTDTLPVKNLMKVIDYDLYCSDNQGTTTNSSTNPDTWVNCTPVLSCRATDREWREYRDNYLALKQKYYSLLRNASCGNICPVQAPVTYTLPGSAPSNNDFSIKPDTGAIAICAGEQSAVVVRNSTASTAAYTVNLYYPTANTTGLTTSLSFASGVLRMPFCVPDTISLSSVLIKNPVILPPSYDTLSVVITDQASARGITTCGGENAKITRTTHVVLKNKNNAPTTTSAEVYLTIDYAYTSDGTTQPVRTHSFLVGVGDSVATDYVYVNNDLVSGVGGDCIQITQTISCIEYVTGGLLSTSGFHTQCTGYTDSIYPPPSCPQVYSSKISRFPTTQNVATYDMSTTAATAEKNTAKTYITQQGADAATGSVTALMDSLQSGLTAAGVPQATQTTLSNNLLQVCEAGVDSAHATGVSDVYGDTLHGSTTYLSFASAMKGVLTATYLPNFTTALNPWLTPGPYPYRTPQQSSAKTISNSNQAICNLLTTLTTAATAAGKTLYNYLVSTYGTAMTLSSSDLTVLQSSCNACKFITASDVTLPVFLDPTQKGAIVAADYTTGVDSLFILFGGSIDTTKGRNQEIMANYLNQRFGFALTYPQYTAYGKLLATQPTAVLCNQMPFTSAVIDSASCLNNALDIAAGSGKEAYDHYTDSLKAVFQQSYLSTCKLAQANATLKAEQQTYHYTLYYYDQADNLVRTVPPEGVTLLNSSLFNLVDTRRAQDTLSALPFTYNGPTTASSVTTAMTTLSSTLSAAQGAVEMWLYNNGSNTNYHWVEATPDRKYLFQVSLAGSTLGIDIYPMNGSTGNSITFIANSRHFSVNISSKLPLLPFTHVVIQGDTLGSATVKPNIFVNGTSLAVSTTPFGSPGFKVIGGSTSVTYPDSVEELKHLILYNHTLTNTTITADAKDQYFNAHDLTYTGWYRFNVPAAGQPPTTVNDNTSDETTITSVFPAHVLATNYNYNSTNQVSTQLSPDGGTNRYWYDLLSRLVVSQNDKQNPLHNYSYTTYDTIGRITEVGQKNQTTLNIATPHYLPNDTLTMFYAAGVDSQVTHTYYDIPVPTVLNHTNGIATVTQNNLRKRVAASTYSDSPGLVKNATYYTYDLDGNVETLWQQVNGLYTPSTNAGLKRIDYEYDLVSGKVNFVRYQDGQPDAFYYSYSYDADNRLTDAWSGTQALVDTLLYSVLLPGNGKRDAHYYYYLHGPLARMELGDTTGRVQGVDYAYTLQGWLKGVNDSRVNSARDMGRDSLHVARDAYGYSLYYYANTNYPTDYTPISTNNPFETTPNTLSSFTPLYNGNIAAMSTNIAQLTDPWHYYTYKYDQLNRIRQTNTYKVSTTAIATAVTDYHETFTYDGNGNIKKASRYMGAATIMDSLGYNYNTTGGRLINNKLNYITDAVTTHTWPYGLDNQTTNNYTYDAIGDMTADVRDTVSNINFNVYGKIQGLNNSKGNIAYSYDPAGQRVTKIVSSITTYYIRDAQGNTLSIYDNTHSLINWKEQDLYGSSRLGLWQPNMALSTGNGILSSDTIGNKRYELSNHLGNVMATITDKRIQHTTNGTTVDYFNADISTAQEYYAFGGLMAGRTYTYLKSYRYGFNNKENDNDANNGFQDYGYREYDRLTGRFISVDPLVRQFAWYSSYQFSGNSPIANIDQDGKEDEPYWKHLLKSVIGYGPEPKNAEEAEQQANERAAVAQVGNYINKMYDAEENTLGVVPGMSAFFESQRGNNKTAAAYFVLDIFGDELLRYAGKGIKYVHPEQLFKIEVGSVELFGKGSKVGDFIITKYKDLGEIGERAWYKYQKQINGLSGSVEFLRNGVKFDGYKNGVLLEAKSQYQWLFKTGRVTEQEIYEKMSQQLGRQITAAAGTKLEWHFAEKETLQGLENYLKDEGRGDLLKKVDLIYTPVKK